MGSADFIVDLPIRHQVVLVLVQFSTVLAANAVPHKIIVEMVGVDMGSNHCLITGECFLGQFQADGVDLLVPQIIIPRNGLHKIVELSSVYFLDPLLGNHHLKVGPWGTQLLPVTSHALPIIVSLFYTT